MPTLARLVWPVYLIFLPVVSAFALTQAITLPFLLGLMLLLLMVVGGRFYFDRKAAALFFLFVGPALLSASVNAVDADEIKFINHTVSYISTFIIYYLVPRHYMHVYKKIDYAKYVYYGWLVAAVFCIAEFVLVNAFFVDMSSFVPRPAASEYNPLVGGLIVRARSFAEESAHFALYAGGVYFFLKHKKLVGQTSMVIFLAALLLTFGIAAWVAYVIALLYLLMAGGIRKQLPKILMSIIVLIVLGVVFNEQLTLFIVNEFSSKLSGSVSADDRSVRIALSLARYRDSSLIEIIFGMGPGYYAWQSGGEIKSVVSLPWLALFQTGVVGLSCLIVTATWYFARARRIDRYLAAAVLFLSFAYLSVSNYWFPWLWFIFAVIDEVYVGKANTVAPINSSNLDVSPQ